jgi:hypothetical protein
MKNYRRIRNIEMNLNKLRIGKEYILGDFFSNKDSNYYTIITRINKKLFIFKHFQKES